MRKKKTYLVVSFHSTTRAMAFERKARSAGLKGRMIPVPADIHSGCGLAWRDDPSARETIETMVLNKEVEVEGMYELIL